MWVVGVAMLGFVLLSVRVTQCWACRGGVTYSVMVLVGLLTELDVLVALRMRCLLRWWMENTGRGRNQYILEGRYDAS